MEIELDNERGQSVGSHIRFKGRAFGIPLSLDEIVTVRNPPQRKVWETTGSPNLVVIGHDRMGFDIMPSGRGSVLRVFIDYALPLRPFGWWLGYLFARRYAAWCTNQMVEDALNHFAVIPEDVKVVENRSGSESTAVHEVNSE